MLMAPAGIAVAQVLKTLNFRRAPLIEALMSEADAPTEASPSAVPPPDNPFANIIINVLAPVLVLSYLSKEGDKLWHVGPKLAMAIALALPIGYGVHHFIKYRQMNVFSLVGLLSVLLTGAITIYLWSGGEAVRRNAALLFGIKEAIQPLILGSLFLLTHKIGKPLFNVFLYNDAIFDVPRIEAAVAERSVAPKYKSLLWRSTLLFFGSFLISSVMNLFLAFYFLGDLDPMSANWKELYNKDVARITGWGFVVIGAPLLVVSGFILWYLVHGLKQLTGLDMEKLMQER